MPFPFKISFIGLGVFTIVRVKPAFAWDYANIAWTTGTCTEDYSAQSPINIAVAAAAEGSAQAPPQQFDFDWEGAPDSGTESAIEGGLVVNNHTWELEWDITDAATNKYGMVVGDKLYRLRQFHYHSPSEHTVDGDHYDMEAHHVHFCEGVSCATEDPDDEILVVSVFIRVGSVNNYLQSFWDQYAPGTEPVISSLANPYTSFMPTDKSYYSYVGSTTTPPCAQNVQWRLLQQHVEMSQEQLTAYHQSVNVLTQPAIPSVQPQGVSAGWAADTKTNNRPLQPLGDRTVLHFVDPQPAAAVAAESNLPVVMPVLIALAAVGLLIAGVYFCLNSNNKGEPKKRGVATKPKPPPPPTTEETVPLVQLQPPMLPLMQAVPQAYTTVSRPVMVAPSGQSVVLQP